MRGHCAEQRPDRRVEDIQTARIGAESRKNQAVAIARKAPPPLTADIGAHAGAGMQMAGDLAGRRAGRRLMAKDEPADSLGQRNFAPKAPRRRGIVIAENENPVSGVRERPKAAFIIGVEIGLGILAMEGVAEGDDLRRPVSLHQRFEAHEVRTRIVRRKEHAAAGEIMALAEMHIRDSENRSLRPQERAFGEKNEAFAVDADRRARLLLARVFLHLPSPPQSARLHR